MNCGMKLIFCFPIYIKVSINIPLQITITIFVGDCQACPESQSNCRILRKAISHKGINGLP